jgi:hypothetical protein
MFSSMVGKIANIVFGTSLSLKLLCLSITDFQAGRKLADTTSNVAERSSWMWRIGMWRMGMWRMGMAACVLAALALAEGFTFAIGSPVAAQDFRVKAAVFVFRTDGCADQAKAQVGGTAEGLVRGVRQSVALKIVAAAKPGIYAVYQTWPAEGAWVISLKGTCGPASAGAIIPIGPKGFIRESSKFFTRAATDAEVEASLKAFNEGGNR